MTTATLHARFMLVAALAPLAAPAQGDTPVWRSQREVVLTAGDPGVSLGRPALIAVSPRGVIAATQPLDGLIGLFAEDGTPVAMVSAWVPGAFDVRRASRFGFRAESVWIADTATNRITIHGPGYALARVMSLPSIPPDELDGWGNSAATAIEAFLAQGGVLLAVRPSAPGQRAFGEMRLHVVRAGGGPSVMLAPLRTTPGSFRVERGSQSVRLPNPFAPVDRFDVSSNGTFIATVHEPRGSSDAGVIVRLFSADGAERYRRAIPIPRRPVTQALLDAEARLAAQQIRSRGADSSVRGYLGNLSMQASQPAVHRILVGDDGVVLLRLTHRHESERWLILGPDGSTRATLSLPARPDREGQDVARDRLWATELTPDGLPQIVTYRFVPATVGRTRLPRNPGRLAR
jgi:hypothetical protein